jgi:RNA polymerase-binding transcription factor DksA
VNTRPACEARDRPTVDRRLQEELDRVDGVLAALDHEALGPAAGSMGELHPFGHHEADFASDTFEREEQLTVLTELRAEREEILAAFGRLAAGVYGICERCGRPIAAERLSAVPAARYCKAHQDEQEFEAQLAIPAVAASLARLGENVEFLAADEDSEATPADEVDGPEAGALHVESYGIID